MSIDLHTYREAMRAYGTRRVYCPAPCAIRLTDAERRAGECTECVNRRKARAAAALALAAKQEQERRGVNQGRDDQDSEVFALSICAVVIGVAGIVWMILHLTRML